MHPADRRIRRQNNRGFTLLELAMVIALMTFLISGIVVGHTMIRASELRSVISDVARYTEAVTDFRDKFRALPGDFSGATDLWGAASADPGTCLSTAGTGTQTCNGNGDGRITTQSSITLSSQYEQFRAWQHMAIAGLIEGYYSGIPGPLGPQDAMLDKNVPSSKMGGGGYDIISMTALEAGATNHYYPLNYLHMIEFGADLGATQPGSTTGPLLTVDEALSIDTKQDDGLPGSGRIIAPRKSSLITPNCTDNDQPNLARYDTTQTGRKCSLIFTLGF